MNVDRRNFLKGAGVAIALPLLESMPTLRAAQKADELRHAQALSAVKAEARRNAEAEHAAAQAKLSKAREERGAALLRAEALSNEAARLREMVARGQTTGS